MQSFYFFYQDIKEGLINLIFEQYNIIRKYGHKQNLLVAVGDTFPLILCWLSGKNFAYIQTKKSDYSWINNKLKFRNFLNVLKGTEWNLFEIMICRSKRARFVVTRDDLSAYNLKKWHLNIITSNPMMDGLIVVETPKQLISYKKIIILPGSRMPELINNFKRIMKIIEEIDDSKEEILYFCPLFSQKSINSVCEYLVGKNFKEINPVSKKLDILKAYTNITKTVTIYFGYRTFRKWAGICDIGITSSGTATEQISGLGVPSVSIVGKGPQFGKQFALRQKRILGGCVSVSYNYKTAAKEAKRILNNKNLRSFLGNIGMTRVNKGGGTKIISDQILKAIYD